MSLTPLHPASLGAVLSACSLVIPFDGLTKGDDPSLARDAATPLDAAASTQNGTDASTLAPPDNASPVGAPPDAFAPAPNASADANNDTSGAAVAEASAPDVAPTASSFCASLSPTPLFCDDFDEGAGTAQWDSTGSHNGRVIINNALSRSPPNALVSTINPFPASQFADGGAYKAFPALAALARIETLSFDMYLDTMDTANSGLAVVGAILLRDASNASYQLQFVVHQSGNAVVVTLPEYSGASNGSPAGFTEHNVNTSVALQTWTRVSIELALLAPGGGSNGNTGRLYFDGVLVAAIPLNVSVQNGVPQAIIGVSYASPPSDTWIVRYDNATFDAHP